MRLFGHAVLSVQGVLGGAAADRARRAVGGAGRRRGGRFGQESGSWACISIRPALASGAFTGVAVISTWPSVR
ncbi:hypothetical protein GCM10023224_43040 [Streptomonospora halophila]|uniref:Uncharacterized protein n=1 Tax=Streptomonospora halophila TaxID=427369 RepID=A0ABP9GTZ2_9ACTN